MTSSIWDETLSVGLDALDQDHRLLLTAIGELRRALGADEERLVVDSVLTFLTDYTAYHFQREERVMSACGFEQLQAHRSQHRRLTDKVASLLLRRAESATIVELLGYLDRWMEVHLKSEDQKYRPVIEANREAAERAASELLPLRYWLQGDSEQPPEIDLSHVHALIAAPTTSLRWLLRSALTQMGIRSVFGAANREAALAAVRKEPIELLLFRADHLDEEDLHFLRLVRELPSASGGSRHLIVLHTSNDPRRKSRALQEGASGLLELPLSIPHLVASVARVAGRAA